MGFEYGDQLRRLLAIEYNCSESDFMKDECVVTESMLMEGRRSYSADRRFFHMATLGRNAVITADAALHPFLQNFTRDCTGQVLFEFPNLMAMERELNRYGQRLTSTFHMFLPGTEAKPARNLSVKWLSEAEAGAFSDDGRFSNALSRSRPNRVALCAMDGSRIMGMAGCTEDAPGWMQIGIDVLPGYRAQGVGSGLVALLKDEILRRGGIPFYGTGPANYYSWNVALNAGFRPAWVEIGAQAIESTEGRT